MAKDTYRRDWTYGANAPLSQLQPIPIIADRAPTTADVNYPIGQEWIYQALDDVYKLTSVTAGVANWEEMGGQSYRYPISPYVVGPIDKAGFQTIQSAIDAVVASGVGGTVYIQGGYSYTENLVLYDGVNICGSTRENTTITGVHTPPATGTVQIQNITLASATSIFSSAALGTANIYLEYCNLNVTNGYVFNLLNWQPGAYLVIRDCDSNGTTDGVMNNTAGCVLEMFDSYVGAGLSTMTATGSVVYVNNSSVNCAINLGGAGALNANQGSAFSSLITTAGTSLLNLTGSYHVGAGAVITHNSAGNCYLDHVTINSTGDVIAGTGTVTMGNVSYIDSRAIAATVVHGYMPSVDRITEYVVGTTGTFVTIQEAINQANAAGGGYVHVQDGTFAENLTLYDNIYIYGNGASSIITGVHTPPAAGFVYFNDLQLTSPTDIITSVAAGAARLRFFNCDFNCTNGYVVDCANWTGPIELYSCRDASTACGIVNVATSTVLLRNSQLGIGANALGIAGGTLAIEGCRITCPVSPTGASTVTITGGCWVAGAITTADTTSTMISDTYIVTGAGVAITHGSANSIAIHNSTISSTLNPCIAGAGAGVITLNCVNFTNDANLAATLTMGAVMNTRVNHLMAGDGTLRNLGFTANGNIIQAYGITTGAAVGTSYRAIRGDLQITTGDGTESPQAVRGATDVLASGDLEEAYGGFFNAYQQDGSAIDSNLIGLEALAIIYETGAADQPQQWIAGSQSVLMFDAAAAVPTASIVCANLNHITYDPAMNGIAHGVVASRNGGGAGNTAAAAYKVVIGGGIVDWNYGLDLLNGGVGALGLYGLGDIRLGNGTIIDSANVTDCEITLPDTGDFLVTMTDSDPGATIQNTVDVAIAAQINGITGRFINAAGATVLQESGVLGYCTQVDGSVITSTATGVEGWLDLLETGAADLPSVYAFAVKGYLDSTDGAGVPTGMVAGVGSVVEYNTPFNAKAYGFLATRLDTGAGAGTAAQAAYGVLQGTVAAADWLYGLDLYNGGTGVPYTNADIRMQNLSTIVSDTEGVGFSGDVEARSFSATNTRIVAFNANPLGQLSGQAGALMTGATGTVNDLVFQEGMMMQNFMIGAGQTKIIPIMEADGLDIALDLTATEGQEMNFGVLASNKHAYTIGTSAAFFFEARFKVADVSGCEPLIMGFRKQEANNGTFTSYTDYATIGIITSQNADLITLATQLNGGAITYTNTTDAWTDGQTHTLRVNVSAAGVVTYLIDGAAPSAVAAYTFDNADVVMPYIHLVHAAVAPGKIHLISLACGFQSWN